MQSLLIFALVVCVAVTGSSGQDDECAVKASIVRDCCAIVKISRPSVQASQDVCNKKHFGEKHPSTPSEVKAASACAVECLFSMEGLLTADKKLDKAAILNHFIVPDTDVRNAVSAKVEHCFGSYEADIDSSLECKSGAREFSICLKREMFVDCPSSLWSGSSNCEELKAKAIKCPKVPVIGKGH